MLRWIRGGGIETLGIISCWVAEMENQNKISLKGVTLAQVLL